MALRSSTDTVWAKFDMITHEEAIPAIEIGGVHEEDTLGADCDLMRGAGALREGRDVVCCDSVRHQRFKHNFL
jgi:hypothetical protein